jgi:hypothetical protein
VKIRKGNKMNSILNGEWGTHVKKWRKRWTSGKRRCESKDIVRKELILLNTIL